MTRFLYTLLLRCACPFAVLALLWRARREPGAWRGFGARFGLGATLAAAGNVWVHAASVGEVQLAAELITTLRARHPGRAWVLTCATPAGRARATALCGATVSVRYAPFDLPGSVARALQRLRPALLVIVEAEIWPNLLAACTRDGIPVVYASARVSARSAAAWARFPALLAPLLGRGVSVAAQSPEDAARFRSLGVPAVAVSVAGNLKFERVVPEAAVARGAALRARYAPGRPLWVAGSTREGEEGPVLQAAQAVAARHPGAVLVLAPRHPPRFEAVAAVVAAAGCGCVRHSGSGAAVPGEPQVVLLDTLGELLDFYAAADVAFVGGSLVRAGGHNLLEPAALGVPVVAGPYQFNAPDVARVLQAAGALLIVPDAVSLAGAVGALLADPGERARRGAAARAVVAANRGALERIVALASSVLQ
ncbi:MAG: 3-deoxy-D-manno-octulosonic acid transferase [Gammaproteobacteria bacterium]|nr:3-deoxy-D-manno-octulosonic acid transferase [Gammaproteobacteria bacterium]